MGVAWSDGVCVFGVLGHTSFRCLGRQEGWGGWKGQGTEWCLRKGGGGEAAPALLVKRKRREGREGQGGGHGRLTGVTHEVQRPPDHHLVLMGPACWPHACSWVRPAGLPSIFFLLFVYY